MTVPVEERELIILNEEILERGRNLRILVKGNSMSPFIREGDMVEVQHTVLDQLRVGDLLLFETEEGELVLHRYVGRQLEVGRTWLRTKGDASRGFDRPISSHQVLGRVVRVFRQGRIRSQEGKRRRIINYLLAKLSPYRFAFVRSVRIMRLQRVLKWIRERVTCL